MMMMMMMIGMNERMGEYEWMNKWRMLELLTLICNIVFVPDGDFSSSNSVINSYFRASIATDIMTIFSIYTYIILYYLLRHWGSIQSYTVDNKNSKQ